MRQMYDAADPANITRFTGMKAGYKTGSPGVNWSGRNADVWIDQAGQGAPDYAANVMDVEPQCYSVSDVPNWTANCTAPVPTVYCDRNDYPNCRSVWNGAIWLAYPGATKADVDVFTVSILGHVDTNIVACQNVFAGSYDRSDVYDPFWPLKKPEGEKEMLTGQLMPTAEAFIPFPKGSFKELIVYRDFTQVPHYLRIAFHSAANGYKVINHVMEHEVPEVIPIAATDVDGISLVNNSPFQIGWTLV